MPLAMAFRPISSAEPAGAGHLHRDCARLARLSSPRSVGSRVPIGGADRAPSVVIVSGIVTVHGVAAGHVAPLMAGVCLIGLGATGMGARVRFIRGPVVVGFTKRGNRLLIRQPRRFAELLGCTCAVPGDFLHAAGGPCAHLETWVARGGRRWDAGHESRSLVFVNSNETGASSDSRAGCRHRSRSPGVRLAVETIGTSSGGIPSWLPASTFTDVSSGADRRPD